MNIVELSYFGKVEEVRKILASSSYKSPEILEVTPQGERHRLTPLFFAAINGQVEVVKLFLEYQRELERAGDGNQLDNWLDYCRTTKRGKIYSLLNKEIRPFSLCMEDFKLKGQQIQYVILKLVSNATVDFSDRAYHVLLGERGSIEAIQAVIDAPDLSEERLEALLEGALRFSRRDVIERLLRLRRIDLQSPFKGGCYIGNSPALFAAVFSSIEVVMWLFSDNKKLLSPMDEGQFVGVTPLFAAVTAGRRDVFQYFVSLDAEYQLPIQKGTHEGETLAYVAAENGFVEILDDLHQLGVDLEEAISFGKQKGDTLAATAAYRGHADVLELLHRRGVKLHLPIQQGSFLGYSLASIAALNDRVEVLKCLHREGIEINRPHDAGNVLGVTPAHIAVHKDGEKVLAFLASIGEDLSQPFQLGKYKGQTLAYIAALSGSLNALKALKEAHVNLAAALTMRPFEGLTPAFGAAANGKFEVLLFLKSEGIYQRKMPQKFDALQGAAAQLLWNQLAPLTPVEMAELMCRKIVDDPSWFTTYKDIFFEQMKEVPPSAWVEKGSFKRLMKIYRAYMALNGDNREWLFDIGIAWINQAKEGINVKAFLSTSGKDSIAFFSAAITPGKPLLQLLEAISRNEKVLSGSNHGQLNEWIGRLLKQPSDDEEFWRQAKGHFQKIHEGIKAKPVQKPVRGKGKGKQKPQKVTFVNLWDRFDQKIKSNLTPPEELVELHKSKVENDPVTPPAELEEIWPAMEQELNQILNELSIQREFKKKQQAMLAEELPLDLSEWEKIKTTIEQKSNALWEKRRAQTQQATTEEQLDRIRESFSGLLEEAQKLQTVTAMPRSNEYIVQRNEALLQENKALRKQVEQLEKKAADRPRSPDKIAPIVEKPTQVALIEKLHKLAGLSKKFQKALNMIEGEGKILTSVDELVKFLGLFKFELKNTVGSHRQYSDGKYHVTIANHTGESKPEEIEDVLRVVFSKLA